MQKYQTSLSFKQQLTDDVFLFRFQLVEPKTLVFNAGQYMIMFVPQANGEPARRIYSIASPVTQTDSFDLLIKLVPGGIASEFLRGLTVGQSVIFQGPAGVFTLQENPRPKIFLATGTGIAPIFSMIKKVIGDQLSVISYLFWGLANYQEVYLFDQLKAITEINPNFKFTICLSREKDLSTIPADDQKYFTFGHVDSCFNMLHASCSMFHDSDFYLCGQREMAGAVGQQLLDQRISPSRIIAEKF